MDSNTATIIKQIIAANDNGFFIYLKNGNNITGQNIALTGVGAVTTLYGPTANTNGATLIVVWTFPAFTAY